MIKSLTLSIIISIIGINLINADTIKFDSLVTQYPFDEYGSSSYAEAFEYRNGQISVYKKYNWNAGTWDKSEMEESVYDKSGNLIKWTEYFWRSNISQWVPSQKDEYRYDTGNNLLMHSEWEWHQSISGWAGIEKSETEYDEYGNKIRNTYFLWVGNTWEATQKNELFYDQNSRLLNSIILTWNNSQSVWQNKSKTEYTYNESGKVATSTGYNWSASRSDWTGVNRFVNSYNESGKCILQFYLNWDPNLSIWVNFWKFELGYDNKGYRILFTESYWNDTSEIWNNYSKYEYEWNELGKMTLEDFSLWNESDSSWIKNDSKIYEFDSNGNQILFTHYNIDFIFTEEGIIHVWRAHDKEERTYDVNGHETLHVKYLWDSFNSDWKYSWKSENFYDLTGIKTRNESRYWVGDEWDTGITTYYFSSLYYINVSPQEVLIGADDSDFNIEVTSNVTWSLQCTQDWLDIDIAAGENNTSFQVTANANPENENRSAKIILSGNLIADTVQIIQSGIQNGIDGMVESAGLDLYPNPTTGKVNITIGDKSFTGRLNVDVYNNEGVLMKSEIHEANNLSNVDLSGFPGGLYMIRITHKEVSLQRKVIKLN